MKTQKMWMCAIVSIALSSAGSALAVPVYYVDASVSASGNGSSWQTAKRTIEEGLALPVLGEDSQVWVRGGKYSPSDSASYYQLRDGVEVYGSLRGDETPATFNPPDVDHRNFETNASILSGDIGTGSLDDNVRVLVKGAANSSSHRLDGFTLTGSVSRAIVLADYAGSSGIYANLFFSKCRTINDAQNLQTGALYGTGIYVGAENGPRVEKCRFEANVNSMPAGGGGAIALNSSFRF